MFDRVSTVNWQNNIVGRDPDYVPIARKYKCYWASSKDYYPRRYLLSHIIQKNLLQDGLFNYKCIQTEFNADPGNENYGAGFPQRYREWANWDSYQQIYQQCQTIVNQIPLPPLDNTIEFNQTNPDFYLNSYLGLITDTTFEDNSVYLSEKLFNAINYYQMFWYLGPPGTLRYLRSL